MIFCIYLVREILFLSGKSQGSLKSDACCLSSPVSLLSFFAPILLYFFTRTLLILKLAAFVLSLNLMLFLLQNTREKNERLQIIVRQLEEALEVLNMHTCTLDL